MKSARLGPLQEKILASLESDSHALTVYDLAFEILCNEEDYPGPQEMRSVYEALRRLERRGLVAGQRTWIRDIGTETAWTSLRTNRTVLDPGG